MAFYIRRWYIWLHSFQSKGKADSLARRLSSGWGSFHSKLQTLGMVWFARIVGVFTSSCWSIWHRSQQQLKDSGLYWCRQHQCVYYISMYLHPVWPSCGYPNDMDIISHVLFLWRNALSFDILVSWVKAHQDRRITFQILSNNSQLNVLADELATAFLQDTGMLQIRPRTKPPFFRLLRPVWL